MVEVEVWEIFSPEELWRTYSQRRVVGKVDGLNVTVARLKALLGLFEFATYNENEDGWVLWWKFHNYGPFAKRYSYWLKHHIDFWVGVGALERAYIGKFGGIGYRITEEGLEILRAFLPTLEIEEAGELEGVGV